MDGLLASSEALRGAADNVFTPPMLLMLFLLGLLAFAIVSVILVYHWTNYSFTLGKVKKVIKLYFVVSGLFLLVMLVSLFYYST